MWFIYILAIIGGLTLLVTVAFVITMLVELNKTNNEEEPTTCMHTGMDCYSVGTKKTCNNCEVYEKEKEKK